MKEITGTMYAYYFLCHRKLWLFGNDLRMEEESENVAIGKLIDENTYRRESKHLAIEDIANIDFLKDGIVYEVKKSDAALDMAANQIKYYLYLLRQRGVEARYGVISVPTKKITERVDYLDADDDAVESNLTGIRAILAGAAPPPEKRIPACSKCAYFELCFI